MLSPFQKTCRNSRALRACAPNRKDCNHMAHDAETLTQILKARYSCRAFKPDPITKDLITQVVATARHAPSWNNTQPWHLIITQKTETDRLRDALYAHAQTASPDPDLDWPSDYPGVLGERRRTCGWALYGALGIQKGDRTASAKQMLENFRFFGAPHVAILTSPRVLGSYGALDAGGFLTAFCLAAQSLGIATIAQAAIAAHGSFIRNWFNIPKDRLILCGVAFGFEDPNHPANSYRTERAAPEDLIDWRS